MQEFKEKLKNEIVASMKAKNTVRTLTLRSISNAIINAEKSKIQLNHIDVLSSLAKSRKQSIEAYLKANNKALADQEQIELIIIEEFLPKVMDDEDIENLIIDIIEDLDNTPTIKDMGKILNKFKECAPGQDMAKVSLKIKSKIC